MRFAPLYHRRYQTDTIDYNAICATLERITATVQHTPIPDTSATPDTVQVSTACYYKRYIRVRPLLWIHARQCSISQTMPARRGLIPLCADRWQVLRPAHPMRCQHFYLYRVSPAAVSILLTPGGLRFGTVSAVMAHRLATFTRRGSPAAETRRAARNHWRLPPQLFSGFRPIANRGQQ